MRIHTFVQLLVLLLLKLSINLVVREGTGKVEGRMIFVFAFFRF